MAFNGDPKEITFVAISKSALQGGMDPEEVFDYATGFVAEMEDAGFFKAAGSSRRSGGSSKRGSSGGRSGGSRTPKKGGKLQGGITERQIDKIIELSDGDYTEDELEDLSKQEASDLIQSLMD